MKYEPHLLFRSTDVSDIQEWLEACEDVLDDFSEKDQEFLDSCRQQFDAKVKQDIEQPLSGKQLVVLRTLFDKIS